MRSLFLSFLVLVSALACLPGSRSAGPAAGAHSPDQPAPGFPLSLMDDAGREVFLAAPPQRIVSLAPSNTEILFALGLGEKLVAVDQFSDYPPEAKQKVQLGSYVRPDLERIVAMQPDLVLATSVHERTVAPELEARQLTVAVIEAKNLEEVFQRIERVGRMTGRQERAAVVVGELQERARSISARVAGQPRPRVFVELSPQLHTAGPGSFIDDLITRAGGVNVAADAGVQWPQLSQEVVLEKDPQVVLLTHTVESADAVRNRSGWQRMSAVREGRVVFVDPDLVTRPGPRVVDGLEAIARALHPERFHLAGR